MDRTVARLSARSSVFILSIIMCLGLSFASHYIGMAAIIGAFLAGLALAEQSEQWRLRESTGPFSDFLTPFFFILIGAQANLRTLFQPGLLAILVAICFIAFISKLIGCGLASLSLGWRNALRVGVGMIPRGEVGLIVAAVGLRLHTISEAVYLVVVGMSLITTLLTRLFSGRCCPARLRRKVAKDCVTSLGWNPMPFWRIVGTERYLSPIHLLEGCFGAEKPSPMSAYCMIRIRFFS